MKKISHTIDLFNEKIGILTSYLAIPLILITFFVAFMRYALDFGSIAIQEITIYLHALIFTVGASYTLKNNMHVRIDIFYNKFSDNLKRNINCREKRRPLYFFFVTVELSLKFLPCILILQTNQNY